MKRVIYTFAVCAALAAGLWFFPAFHVVPLKQAQAAREQATFNPADFATKFWRERLTPAFNQAADAPTVLAALAKDPKAAATNYGRTVGLSDAVYFFMRGTGTVVSVEAKGVGVSLRGREGAADLLLKTGLLFGNTVRDATGLMTASEFPNSHEFNDVSTALNRMVESRVIPLLKTNAAVGRPLRFVVCAEVGEDDAGERPLKVIPVSVELP